MISRRRKLMAGEHLFSEGDDSLLVANVIFGTLKLTISTEDGREQIVGVLYPSDFIGRPFGSISHQSATALSDAMVCVYARPDFDRFAANHPALEHKLLERALDDLDRTRKWMLSLARKSAEEKVATFLLEMSEQLLISGYQKLGGGSTDDFELPFSRQQVGEILGVSTETVSRQITSLKRDRIIDLLSPRTVRILDRSALEELAG